MTDMTAFEEQFNMEDPGSIGYVPDPAGYIGVVLRTFDRDYNTVMSAQDALQLLTFAEWRIAGLLGERVTFQTEGHGVIFTDHGQGKFFVKDDSTGETNGIVLSAEYTVDLLSRLGVLALFILDPERWAQETQGDES